MFLLISLVAAGATNPEPVDVDAISTRVDACLGVVRAEYEAGATLPTRAERSSINAELCSKEPSIALFGLESAREVKVREYTEAHARLEADAAAKGRKAPALSGEVTVEDDWVTAMLKRAEAAQVQASASPEAARALGAWTEVERLDTQISVLDASVLRVRIAVRQYLTLRDALWLMGCNGKLDLAYPEVMPNDARYTYEQQCEQLSRHRGITISSGNPGAAKR